MLEMLQKNEPFVYKKLSKEEMESRGILGRLVGPCADFLHPTRNGRDYTEPLWENVFSNDIVLEKIQNKCLFGELGHPLDREEVDPEKIAIALNEVPKKNSKGQLIACFDILNTPSGKILKTLCDYGTTIGISSRGTGDLINEYGKDIVDPDTYQFECFDAVLLPAVKEARVTYMTESLDTKASKLKKALKESVNNASIEDRKIMEDTLKDLNISLDDEDFYAKHINAKGEFEVVVEELNEDKQNKDIEDNNEVVDLEIPMDDEDLTIENTDEKSDVDADETAETAADITDDVAVEKELPETEVDTTNDDEDKEKDTTEIDYLETDEIIINLNGNELTEDEVNFTTNEDGKLIINITHDYSPEMDDNIDETEADATDEETIKDEVEEKSDEAEDNGEDEILENFKEIVRQKDLLENELRALKSLKTVEDIKVKELTEDVNKYKTAFNRTSEIAARVKSAEANVKSLTEKLNSSENELQKLKAENSVKLTESISVDKQKIKSLTESLAKKQGEYEDLEDSFKAKVSEYEKKLSESIKIAKAYKEKSNKMLEQYISFRANMLGVRPNEIVNRLSTKPTMEEINSICDKILTENISYSRPNTINTSAKVKITEQKDNSKTKADDYDWESLYELAGL